MTKQTHKQKMEKQLLKKGYLSRNWCLKNYMPCLAQRVADLKKDGYNLVGRYKKTRWGLDYRYYLQEV